MAQQLLSWKTKEFQHYEKGPGWYITLGILGVLIIAYTIFLRDYFATLTFIILIGAVYFFAKQTPEEIWVSVTNTGITVGEIFFPYASIKRFWIVHHRRARKVHFETTAYLNRTLIVLLEDQDPDTVAEVLRKHLPETEPNKESVAQRIARKLKF